jgi:hypothetical protein
MEIVVVTPSSLTIIERSGVTVGCIRWLTTPIRITKEVDNLLCLQTHCNDYA